MLFPGIKGKKVRGKGGPPKLRFLEGTFICPGTASVPGDVSP